jgi:phospholipase A1/A2
MSVSKWFFVLFLFVPISSFSETDNQALQKCLQQHVLTSAGNISIDDLKRICENLIQQNSEAQEDANITETAVEKNDQEHPFAKRLEMEALDRSNRFMLTPHKRNYFYPISHSRQPNTDPYQNTNSTFTQLDHTEAELQLSIKILLRESIFDDNGHLYLGYTNHSFWQVYSDKDSAPFRATDHQPEFILSFTNDWKILGFNNSANQLILNHQSNGTGGLLSRSWNRIIVTSVFERNNFVFSLSPWYRIPEPKQKYPGDPDGDDNPDITHFMGNFEFSSAYTDKANIYSMMLRNNFDADNKGAIELGWSFPISNNLRGQFNYFNGYGHSLIDYNHDQEVFTLGIIFTDLF